MARLKGVVGRRSDRVGSPDEGRVRPEASLVDRLSRCRGREAAAGRGFQVRDKEPLEDGTLVATIPHHGQGRFKLMSAAVAFPEEKLGPFEVREGNRYTRGRKPRRRGYSCVHRANTLMSDKSSKAREPGVNTESMMAREVDRVNIQNLNSVSKLKNRFLNSN